MSISKLTNDVYVLDNTDKINEIIDQLNSESSIIIDSELSSTSENPVQNKVITAALSEKQDLLVAGTGLSLSGTTLNHSNTISAGMAGNSEASSGSTVSIPYISYDSQGHITEKGEITHTITGFLTEHQNLSEYAKLTDIPESISAFANDIGYLTEHQDLSEYALLSDIPESVSAFDNDAGYLTVADLSEHVITVEIPESISAFTNDVGYLVETDLSEYALLTDIPQSISAFDNDAGYLTEHQDLSEYQKIETAVTHESNTAVGSTTQPVYITSSGTVSEIAYTIAKSVPSDAVFTDTTYTAGTGISISEGVISSTQTSAEWGNITGTLSEQSDLQTVLNAKQNSLTAGSGISINNDIISATATNTTYTATCPAITPVDGIATWEITHNLNTQSLLVSLYTNNREVSKDVLINSNNKITVAFEASTQVTAGNYKVVVLASGTGNVSPTAGQWIDAGDIVLTNSSTTNVDIDLSSYLPNDNYNYEILVYGQVNVGSGIGGYRNLEVSTSLLTGPLSICAANQTTSSIVSSSSTIIIPIGTDRKFKVNNRPYDTGNYILLLKGYRRLGSDISSQSSTDPNFIPKGTIIHVELDGSGDFTTLQDVITYLNGKWSNGKITIKFGTGTFSTEDNLSFNSTYMNIPEIEISGNGINNTILSCNGATQFIYGISTKGILLTVSDLTYTKTQGTKNTQYRGFGASFATMIVSNVKTIGCGEAFLSECNGIIYLQNTVQVYDALSAFVASIGKICSAWGTQLTLNNVGTAIAVFSGGYIQFAENTTLDKTGVTTTTNQTKGTITNNGYISAPF